MSKVARRGLVIRWSKYPTWIEMRDPLSGEWYELRAADWLPGIVETANANRKKGISA